MEINELVSFITVVDKLSFSKAAKTLYLSQPAISTHIRNIESKLKVNLIDRSFRKVKITKEGELLYKGAKNIIQSIENLKKTIIKNADEKDKIIEIYISSIAKGKIISDVIEKYSLEKKDIKFEVISDDTLNIVNKLLRFEIDYALIGSDKFSRELEYKHLFTDELILISNKTKKLELSQIYDIPIIMREYGSATRELLINELKKLGIDISKLNIIATIKDSQTIMELVKKGYAFSFISKNNARKSILNKEVYKVQVDKFKVKREVFLAYNKEKVLSQRKNEFLSFLKNINKNLEGK